MIFAVYFVEIVCRSAAARVRGLLLELYLRMHGCRTGRNLRCRQLPHFRTVPDANIYLGNSVTIGRNVTFDVSTRGRLEIGDYVNLTQDITISSDERVDIGAHTLVAEYVSIRDADHRCDDPTIPKAEQGMLRAAVSIGKDVWIGAGARILRGATVPDGAVIAANAVVLAKCRLKARCVHAGAPAVVKKEIS